MRFFSGNPTRADFDDLARHVVEGKLSPAVDAVFPLEETAAAHRALEAGGVRGKYVVEVAWTPGKVRGACPP
ncbi:zinc-binding dehydrogenase [Actinomadura rifamycini]|uniref:zinc-binding dehydrogenase n=1 Tax=Actinomadura rifamycini TaxID=31962 RepID=UPI000415C78A|nr:zinc-binding dehydrogenase [Actinomadura rifamycini]